MPESDTFYFPPAHRLPWMDALFAVFGRALALATRFEGGVYALCSLISLRRDARVLESEDSLRSFSEQLRKGPLAKAARQLADQDSNSFVYVFNVLNDARKARNELVHEATLGFEHWAEDESEAQKQLDHLRIIVRRLAMADRLLSGLATFFSNDPMPTKTALQRYRKMLEEWVFFTWDIET